MNVLSERTLDIKPHLAPLAVRKYLLPRIDSFIPVPMSGFVYYSKVESAGWLERDEMEKMSSRKGMG